MIDHCGSNSNLAWLHRVIVALSQLGLRIDELIGLRWSAIDLQAEVVRVADERASSKKSKTGMARTTKGRRAWIIPLHPDLTKMLLTIPRHKDGRVFHSTRHAAPRENNALKIVIWRRLAGSEHCATVRGIPTYPFRSSAAKL
jgi:integrase